MTVSALGASAGSTIIDLFKQRRAALRDVEDAVRSGDIKAAQQSLASAGPPPAAATDSGRTNTPRSVVKTDLSSLMEAVQNGDLDAARSALDTLDKDKSSLRPTGDAQSGTAGSSFLADLKSLIEATQSGDDAGKASALGALQLILDDNGSSPTAAGPAATTDAQSGFMDDIKALLDAAKANDTQKMQDAAKKIANDIQAAVSGLRDAPEQATDGTTQQQQHHHHHHASKVSQTTLQDAQAAYELLMDFGDGPAKA